MLTKPSRDMLPLTLIYRCLPLSPTHAYMHTHSTHTHASDVFLWSTVTVCVTDLISPTICWLEAQHPRSYPVWQKQTASVYACFSQGLAQYGGVESLSWPPNLHPCTLASKDLEIISRTCFRVKTCLCCLLFRKKIKKTDTSTTTFPFSLASFVCPVCKYTDDELARIYRCASQKL